MRKPRACQGCPYYGDGEGFVPDDVQPGRRVTIYNQNPGSDEEREGKPMIGKTGQLMDRAFLPLAGLTRDDVNIANTLRCRVNGSNELPPLSDAKVHEAMRHCTRAYAQPALDVKLVVACGAYALPVLTGLNGISTWRGWMVPLSLGGAPQVPKTIWTPAPGDTAVLATLHIAALFRNPELQVPAKSDWKRIGQFLASKWPEPFPTIHRESIEVWPEVAAFDTEFHPDGEWYRYSAAWRTAEGEPIVYVVEREDAEVRLQQGAGTYIFHNTEADQDTLDYLVGAGTYEIEDSMHAHAVLAGGIGSEAKERKERGSPHNLDFLGSLWARSNRWKHLVQSNPIQYAGGDALGTWDAWYGGIVPAFRRDPAAEWIYRHRQMPLLPIIRRRRAKGIRVDRARVGEARQALMERVDAATAVAQLAVGWPINLGSPPQVAKQLYDVEQFGKRRVTR